MSCSIRSVEKDERTDMMKLTVAFRSYANALRTKTHCRGRHDELFLKHILLKNSLINYFLASLLSITIDFKHKLRLCYGRVWAKEKNLLRYFLYGLHVARLVRNTASTTESWKESWPLETNSITHKGQREYRNRKNKGRAGKRKV
jgi:hypothetical protein